MSFRMDVWPTLYRLHNGKNQKDPFEKLIEELIESATEAEKAGEEDQLSPVQDEECFVKSKSFDPREDALKDHTLKLKIYRKQKGGDSDEVLKKAINDLWREISGLHTLLFRGSIPELSINDEDKAHLVANSKKLIEEQNIDEYVQVIKKFFIGSEFYAAALKSLIDLESNFESSKNEAIAQAQTRLDEYAELREQSNQLRVSYAKRIRSR